MRFKLQKALSAVCLFEASYRLLLLTFLHYAKLIASPTAYY